MITAAEIEAIISGEYENCLETLNEISKDSANNKSLLPLPHRFHHYDRIGELVFRGKDKPKTPDMIFFKNETIFFVEFKSGRIEGIRKKCELRAHENDDECQYVKWDIKLKAIEGAFIVLHKIVETHKGNIDFSTILNLKKCYILVYYDNAQPGKTIGEKKFGNHLAASKIRFGLNIYKGTFFHDIATFTPRQFEKKLKEFNLIVDSPR